MGETCPNFTCRRVIGIAAITPNERRCVDSRGGETVAPAFDFVGCFVGLTGFFGCFFWGGGGGERLFNKPVPSNRSRADVAPTYPTGRGCWSSDAEIYRFHCCDLGSLRFGSEKPVRTVTMERIRHAGCTVNVSSME